MFEFSAQGSLEYLLMIGAAILIVAVVIIAVAGLISDTDAKGSTGDYNTQMSELDKLNKNYTSGQNLNEPAITSFVVEEVVGRINGNTISVILPYTSTVNLSSFTPTIRVRKGVVSPSEPQDFTKGPVTYTVTDSNGNTKLYSVTITKSESTFYGDKNILEFYFDELGGQKIVPIFNNSTKTVDFSFPYGTQTTLTPYFIISNGASIMRVGDDLNSPYCDYNSYYIGPEYNCFWDNSVPINFSNPVEYIITAKDGSTKKFTLRVEVLPDSSKSILFFEIYSPLSVGVINENAKTISIKVPSQTNITSFTPNIKISQNATINPSLGVAKNFTTPVTYTVTAMDDSTQQYTVSVIKENTNYTLISTCQELQNINLAPDANYKLTNNIDCNNFNFSPINFSGIFDGDGKTISNLKIILPNNYLIGLFGSSNGIISNLGVINGDVVGMARVGILVGNQSGGLITNSYSTGKVYAMNGGVGGLVGWQEAGIISNCYSDVNVSSSSFHTGGLVGNNYGGVVFNSYSYGTVLGAGGGLIGGNSSLVFNSYWDTTTSGQAGSFGGTGKTTSEMKTASTFVEWNTTVWNLVDGKYPTLVGVEHVSN